MDNGKFQEFIADQFTKLFSEFQGLKSDVGELKQDVSGLKQDVAIIKVDINELKESHVRLESEFHNQITALHDFRVSQEKTNLETKIELLTLGTKLEELQLETAHLRVAR